MTRRATTLLPILIALLACGGDEEADLPPLDRGAPAPSGADRGGGPQGDTSADAVDPRNSPDSRDAGDQEGWAMPPLRNVPAGSGQGVALLQSVRTGRHEGYDRVVFEFAERIPEYTIRYVQDPTACGSGEAVPVDAPALEIDLRPAAAHNDAGNPTFQDRVRTPGLPTLESARITCDFEAIVTWVLGLSHRAEVRTLELTSPPRLVVDVRHR